MNKFKSYILYLLLAVIAVIQTYPFVWLVFLSLKSNSEITGGNIAGLPKQFLWENYASAFLGGKISLYLFNSLLVSAVSIGVILLFAAMAAYAIARMRWRLSRPTLTFFLTGMMIPIHATLIPLFIFFKETKMLNTYWALILPYAGFGLPLAIFILVGFMRTIPGEMEESAFIDGAGIFRIFGTIILPMVKSALATVTIFSFLSVWNELMFALTFITKTQYKTLTVGLQTMVGQYATKWGPIGAGLVIGALPALLIYLAMSAKIQHSLGAAGAVKG